MTTSRPADAIAIAWPEFNSREDLLKTPAWVVQYSAGSAVLLRQEWAATSDEEDDGEGFVETPAISRSLDEIRPGDFVLFWISGPADSAGFYAWGNASGEVTERDYPKDWSDPDGPRVRKTGMEVEMGNVFSKAFVTRTVLQQFPEFESFELFVMPNRANAFAVTPAQWSIILDHLTSDSIVA